MRQKWQKRRGFLKIHVAADVKSKQITGLEITDDHSHDSKSFVSLVEQSKQFGNVTKTLADGAYDTKDNFSYLKRMFGEHVTSHKRENMIHELKMKVCLYNKMIAIQ